ncbi:VOC family protein [Frigidibacter albus]|uniref:VOC family protein n=1 Tax=Frigidibacter albus TaxID=1465486 RepID=A0A6L8VDT5_9RHOB|nr:VOC family protein [Frigidibacter albus]MZQ88488.1 VOC family protein [Frigidibacter albus]NBE30703.1 VOC family protein [Frigidibacter albus]GGH48624.1 ring-cleaving dioxygenase [Frigidibacter albus]
MATSDAPLEIGHVALTVRDLDAVAAFYQRALGLDPLSQDGEIVRLGTGDRTLLELRRDPAARVSSPREAGLFHTAFLLPARADLGRWLAHAAESGLRLQGASDHLVSEAVYLADPEGNGIEVYVDRPRAEWPMSAGGLQMASDPMDHAGVLAAAGGSRWAGIPEGSVVGHVHLQVGALDAAEGFYGETLGMALTVRYRGANFFGAGGYHHHVGTNIWNSRGAGRRAPGTAGLAEVVLRADPAELAAIAVRAGVVPDGPVALQDPWGTAITVEAK